MSVHRYFFLVVLAVWTWLLLKPNPVPEIIAASLMEDVKFLLGKGLHLASYTVLAWYGTYRLSPAKWKWVDLGLGLHAVLTELGQYYGDLYFQTHRTGRVADVLIDWAGVVLGAWLRQRFARISRNAESA